MGLPNHSRFDDLGLTPISPNILCGWLGSKHELTNLYLKVTANCFRFFFQRSLNSMVATYIEKVMQNMVCATSVYQRKIFFSSWFCTWIWVIWVWLLFSLLVMQWNILLHVNMTHLSLITSCTSYEVQNFIVSKNFVQATLFGLFFINLSRAYVSKLESANFNTWQSQITVLLINHLTGMQTCSILPMVWHLIS